MQRVRSLFVKRGDNATSTGKSTDCGLLKRPGFEDPAVPKAAPSSSGSSIHCGLLKRPAFEDPAALHFLLRTSSDSSTTSTSSTESSASESDVWSAPSPTSRCAYIDLSWESLEEEDPWNSFTAHLASQRRPTRGVGDRMKERSHEGLERVDELSVLLPQPQQHPGRGKNLPEGHQFTKKVESPVDDFSADSRRVYRDSIAALCRWTDAH